MYWEKVKGSEIYEVSSKGSVRNTKTGTVVKHGRSTNGRHKVALYENGRTKGAYVDDLMADAFLTGKREGRKIFYVDGDYNNLDLTNLCVRSEPEKRILEVVSGRIFNSRSECCSVTNTPPGVLSRCLRGKMNGYKGMCFKKIE